jgi:mono/diheme cytochrome c family protein
MIGVLVLCMPLMSHARAPQGVSHIHGVATSAATEEPLLGTHDGVYRIAADGSAMRVSTAKHDFMALVQHPTKPDVVFASGHPSGGGNLGLLRSDNGGKGWTALAEGAAATADFHFLTVSVADPNRLYGEFQGLQTSRDGGRNWQLSGKLPERTLSISGSSLSAEVVYAATEGGLMKSMDAGKNWQPMTKENLPATLVYVTGKGKFFAHIVGGGLMVSDEESLQLKPVFDAFGARVPLKMAQHPANTKLLYVLDNASSVWRSTDAGINWSLYVPRAKAPSELAIKGERTYKEFCVTCHGAEGVGETHSVQSLTSREYISAPPLDASAHAWHHTDDQLAETIRNGSPRTGRMPAWGALLTDQDVDAVIAYMKSLWTDRELGCQGPKHMQCM